MANVRVGLGFDAHPHGEGRALKLGGLELPGETGLAGHSDGDVVCHALADAFLGAAALGDIGQHFPEDDPDVEGIGGATLLGRVIELVTEAGFAPVACDVVVIAERPRLSDIRDDMRTSVAGMLGLGKEEVSVKATRPEGLGLRGDGIGCMALATVEPAP